MQDVPELLEKSLEGLGYELVDFERSGRGLLRVYIDKPGGIGVEDCATVSNHLSRLFVVENIEYDRMEVSSPGLDRPLRKAADFQRFAGQAVNVRLYKPLEGRKRFNAVIMAVSGDQVELQVVESSSSSNTKQKVAKSAKSKVTKHSGATVEVAAVYLKVMVSDIERARLIPDI